VKLVIVESPAKARTIGRILGTDYAIKATLGHVRDLPRSELGIDITNDFAPRYVAIKQRKKVLGELKKSAEDASAVYLATDPDREGEAISWHLVETIK
jgi:DNA topoisomerase-1